MTEPPLPKWAQQTETPLPKWAQEKPKPSGPTGGLGETWARTKELGASVRNDVQDELALGNDIIAAGKEKLAQPGVLPKIAGAADIGRGEINKVASPLTAVWNALGMADPMMTGGETVHMAGKGLKAAETPKATYPTGPKSSITQVPMPKWAAEANASAEEAFQAEHGRTKAQAASWPLTPETPAAPHAETWPHAAPTPAHVTPRQNPIAAPAVLSGGQVTTGPNHATIENATGAQDTGATAAKPAEAKPFTLSSASASTSDVLKGTIADREAGEVSEAGVINSLRRVGRVVKAILAPQTLDANAAKAAGQVRKALGTATRAAERDKATITAFQEHIRSFDMQDKLDIIDFMQSEKQLTQLGLSLPPEDAPLIQAMRDIFQGWKRKLEAAPSTEQMRFQEEYFPQQWKDPEKAVEFAKTFGTKEGSGGFTKAKKIPTVADGIRAGLEPVTHDPIDATLRYVDNVSRFLAVNEVFDDAVASSHVVWRAAGQEPAGWVKVDGRLSNKYPGQNAYAPEGWAAVYNNFTSRQPAGAFGDLLSGVQKISNSVTAFKLGLSGFHAMNMVGESFVGGIANAVDELASGHPIRALKGMATAPAKWITNPRKGAQMLKTYLSDIGSPELRKVVELATEANFRVAGKGRVADEYRFTSQGSLWESFRKGALKAEAAAAMRDIKGAPVAGTLKHLASTTARVLETISDPLFKHYIPALKNGAYYDMLSTWLNAHPAATVEEQVAFARQAADIIDDRFGEMNQDNIFWQKWLKQAAQASMVSYSYEMGTFRSFAGAADDLAKAPVRAVKGQPVWTPKMSYAFVALPVGVALMGATYQRLKTGKAPDKLMDLYYPQTGGKDAKSGLPERAVLPSYMSQVFNFAHDPRGELANKGNGAFELMRGAFSGTDWRGDPITLSTDSTGEALKKYMEFALKAWEPITFENRAKKGTALSGPERFTGIRSAPMFATDPKGYEAMEKGRADRADKLKKRHDETAKRVYGGTQ